MSALEGIRVLDLSTGVAGPVVGMFLGDFGADVIKIEGPDADPAATAPGYAVWNRNKRSVTVDPEVTKDVEWLIASISRADVCILGVADNLSEWGAEVAEAGAKNSGLIVLRLPPYIDGYTPWAGGGESNGLLSAYGGQAMRQASSTGGPIESMSPHMLLIQGTWATTSLVAALVERTISGRGQVVTVTGMNGLMEATTGSLTFDPAAPDPDMKIGAAGRHPTYRQFVCADGTWLACGALGLKFETALLIALGLEDILADPRIDGVTGRMVLPENQVWTVPKIAAAFASRSRDELLEMLAALGIPAGPVLSREEWFDHPQVRAIGMHVRLEDPERGPVEMPGSPIVLTKTPARFSRHAPAHGEHNGIAPWPARQGSAPSGPRYVEGPLAGFRILNLGTFVASPFAGFLLSELGADVIKVEPVTGDPFRGSGGYTFNRGMRSLAVNLASPAGQEAVHRLVKTSDVIMDGMRPGVMTNLHLDYPTLAAVNPSIIALSLSAYGEGGPLSREPGVDMVIQAMSGMMSSWGGSGEPMGNTIAINDVTTAAISALATVVGLYHRQITGEGQRIWDSLAGTSVFLQMNELVAFDGRSPAPVGRPGLRGLSPLQSYYQVADGWIYLDSALAGDLDAVIQNLRAGGLIAAPTSDDALANELAASLVTRTAAVAIREAEAAGLRAARARQVSEVLQDPLLLQHEAFHIRTSDDTGAFMTPGRYAGFSRTQRRGPLSPDGVGESTVAILEEAGLSSAEIDDLLADGVVRAGGRVHNVLPIAYR